jgi:uncharacterized repeat protein (TIGR03803 family)
MRTGTRYLAVSLLLVMAGATPRSAAQTVTLTVLYALNSTSGANPDGALTADRHGDLCGPAFLGGASNLGTIFQLIKPAVSGGAWNVRVLHTFTGGNDGANPAGPLVFDSQGALYGTTVAGGLANAGTVFQLTPPSAPGGAWTESLLYSFAGTTDGASPTGGLLLGAHGQLYGTTSGGGAYGNGTVFALLPPSTSGGTWVYNVLHSFAGGPGDGAVPGAGLTAGPHGVLFGTAYSGGTAGTGMAFQLTPPATLGAPWTESVLYNFKCGSDAGHPDAILATGTGGVLYGTTGYCGSSNYGTAYRLTPPATPGGAWTESVLYTFSSKEANPYGGVVLDQKLLLGTTYGGGSGKKGTLYELKPPSQPGGPWTITVLHSFSGVQDGFNPLGGLLLGSPTSVYGTAGMGGSHLNGTVFQLTF